MTTLEADARTVTSADVLLRDFHDARRREDQWRIPQMLLALLTPLVAFITAVALVMGRTDWGTPAAALTVIFGTAAALLGIEVWRWHRIALSRVNQFRTDYPSDAALLMKDPL